ncbi:enoyl-CoA hydratase/isomerase family protein [Cumulibacter manganitolerans]|uniref:enoyl-CoA hydratase/isomerase family protein n=1 Tax=Cumulibacter manganitolerans TaxID=1884992 RepID=UPI00129578A3|nr:enoyl-CoA hydratase/isomerase family protein [Cumulibacter manganitolerans]
MSHTDLVLVDVVDSVATVSFNRPAKLNALGPGSSAALHDALQAISRRDDVRAVVLTGEGRSFCVGLDLESDFGGDVVATYASMRESVATVLLMRSMPQPVIAAVQGNAVGGGFAFTTACDIRIAGRDARFVAPFASIGMSAGDLGLTWLLPRIIGPGRSAKVFYTGDPLLADEAAAIGLADEVVDDPRARAIEIATAIAAKPPFGVRHSKELLNASIYGQGYHEHLETELRSQVVCSLSADFATAKQQFAAARRK